MMKILDRYIISSILKIAIVAIIIFALILAAVELFSKMDAIMNSDMSIPSLIEYLLYSIPEYLMMGASLAFLIFNMHPAKMFLGDTGSLALGGAVAAMALIMKMPIYLLIVALIPVVETLSVAMQVIYFKITKGKRLFLMSPLHHHFELKGYSEWKIDWIFWSFGIIVSIISVIFVCLR